jgi:hypothetical protein
MGNVDLPLIAGETGIEAALEVMQGFGRSGLVTTRNDTYVVLTDEDLIDGYRVRGHRMVAEVGSRHRTLVVSPKFPRYQAVMDRVGGYAALDEILTLNYGHFALQPSSASMIAVRTVAEAFASMLGQRTVVCTCSLDGSHKWRPPQLIEPGKCNLDGKPVNCK